MFETISDLQSSQTINTLFCRPGMFETISDLQSSQTMFSLLQNHLSLRLFLIYKALKLCKVFFKEKPCLRLFLIYKALKPMYLQKMLLLV